MRTLGPLLIAVAGALAPGAAACGKVSTATDAAPLPEDSSSGPDATRSWSPFTAVAVDYPDTIRTPAVSGDGLTLYFLAQLSNPNFDFDIYSASRASTSAGFGVATALINVNVAGEQARYPEISDDGLELYYSRGDLGQIMVSTRSNTSSVFGAPAPVRSGVSGNFASISANKLALYYVAQISGIEGMVMRITRAAVGQPWSTPSMVTLDGAVQIYSSIDISKDELALLRAPTLAPQSLNVLISRRNDRNAAFDRVEVLQAIDTSASAFGSARWSVNDTEIWVGQPTGGVEKPYVSRFQ